MNALNKVARTVVSICAAPRTALRKALFALRGEVYAKSWVSEAKEADDATEGPDNDLLNYFEAHSEGSGIWKWHHYFEIYDRHFRKFRDKEVHIVEVGIYSGGSLRMWKDYFGSRCRVYGVDIQQECKAYGEEGVTIFIGDQGDRSFWRDFRDKVPVVDILIDDGGHTAEQQIVTLEEMLPHIRPGGIYLCEDITGALNPFSDYLQGFGRQMNHFRAQPGASSRSPTNPLQSGIHSFHHYPILTVVEKRTSALKELSAPRRGGRWMPG